MCRKQPRDCRRAGQDLDRQLLLLGLDGQGQGGCQARRTGPDHNNARCRHKGYSLRKSSQTVNRVQLTYLTHTPAQLRSSSSIQKAYPDATTLVRPSGPQVTAQQGCAGFRRRDRDESIVCCSTGDAEAGQRGDQGPVVGGRQQQTRFREPGSEEVPDQTSWCAVWRRQTRQDRIHLEGGVSHKPDPVRKGAIRRLVPLVPGGERRDDDTGVSRDHRRVCSRVALTCSAVSGGSSISGTATTRLPRPRRRIAVGATAISSRPS